MSATLLLRNRQRTRSLNLRLLRRIARCLLHDLLEKEGCDLAFWFVGVDRITELNEQFLQHAGPTDVITFDYFDAANPDSLHGEVFICVDVTLAQARRFRTDWRSELVRYLIHGVLHLSGYDDQQPAPRRRMKQAEDRFLREISTRFNLRLVGS